MALEREHDEEMDNLLKRRNAIQQRRNVLQLQVDQYGRAAPAYVKTELAEANRELADLNAQIVPETPAFLDRMSELERSKYNTGLILGLEATIVESREESAGRERRYLLTLAALAALQAMRAPNLTWHLWLFALLIASVLVFVGYDIWRTERRRKK